MFETLLSTSLTLIALLIIIVLSAAAVFLHWQLHLRRKRDAQLFAEQEQKIAKQRSEAANSLRIIAKSYLSEQVELGEASIRISKVMDTLGMNEQERMPYNVFDQVHSKLAHIPILQEWKALSKKEKRDYLKTIESVQVDYQDFAKSAAKGLVDFDENKQPTFYSAA